MGAVYFVIVLAAVAGVSANGWKSGKLYKYSMEARSLAALHQVQDQYSGMVIIAEVDIIPKTSSQLIVKVQHPVFAEVHTTLPQGWSSPLLGQNLKYKDLPMSNKPFELILDGGVVKNVLANRDIPEWELNMLKGIASQLQVDSLGRNSIKSSKSKKPDSKTATAFFKTMEKSVVGECETNYDISPLPHYLIQDQPELAPVAARNKNGSPLLDVVKAINFSNCDRLIAHNWGFSRSSDPWEGIFSAKGAAFSRSSITRSVIEGNVQEYLIHSSVITNKVIMSPTLTETHKGILVNLLNLTLTSASSETASHQGPSNPRTTDTIYEYESLRSERHDEQHRNYGEDIGRSRSSEEEDHHRSALNQPPSIPLLPFFVGSKGKAITSSSQVSTLKVITKLSEKIANDLLNPNNLQKENTLARFTILIRAIQITNHQELEEVTHKLFTSAKEPSKSKSNAASLAAWRSFRDAVAQAGTAPALAIIRDWIKDKKLKSEEAAEIVGTLEHSVQTPTPEYMDSFFDLITSTSVTEQQFLNSSAVMAFTNVVRMVQVDNATRKNYFPCHIFESLAPKNLNAVQTRYIPYFAKELKKAMQQKDSQRIHLNIQALGNIAHPKILNIFEPYLEGKQPSTSFQRLLMVVSLNKMTQIFPNIAMQVLFRIYENVGEVNKVRCAAVFQIMRTNPPAYILQRMAEFTNNDPSDNVNSAVKSAIERASQLKNPLDYERAMNAQAAADLLFPKVYSLHYSKEIELPNILEKLKFDYEEIVNYIASEDSKIPNSMFYTRNQKSGGILNREMMGGVMVSSVNDLLNYVYDMEGNDERSDREWRRSSRSRHRSTQNHYNISSEKISQMLGVLTDNAEQLEGNILLQFLGSQRLFTFDSYTLEQIPAIFQSAGEALRSGRSFNFTKLFIGPSLTLAFPNPIGLVNQISISNPVLIKVDGEASLRTNPDATRNLFNELRSMKAINITSDINVIYASKCMSRLAVMSPFNSKEYIAGLEKNLLVQVPIRAKGDVDLKNRNFHLNIQPFDNNKEYKILHISAVPFTSQHNILNFDPLTNQQDTKLIHVHKQEECFNAAWMESARPVLKLTCKTEDQSKQFRKNDVLSWLNYQFSQSLIFPYEIDLNYDARESSAKSIAMTVSYDDNHGDEDKASGNGEYSLRKLLSRETREKHSQTLEDESSEFYSKPRNKRNHERQPLSVGKSRQQELLNKAANGIKNANAAVLDISVQLNGERNVQYITTAAYGYSNTDTKTNFLFFVGKESSQSPQNSDTQVCFAVNADWARVPLDNFKEALKAEPHSNIHAQLNFGESCISPPKVTVQCNLHQSDGSRKYMGRHPLSKLCEDQMSEGNNWLPACRNVTIRANFIDLYECTAKFKELPNVMKNYTYKAYSLIRYLGQDYLEENVINSDGQRGKASLSFKFQPNHKSINISIKNERFNSEFRKIPIHPYLRPLIVVHPQTSAIQRLARKLFTAQNQPTCVADADKVNTFDNKTYPFGVGKCWHALLTTAPLRDPEGKVDNKKAQKYNATILIRDISDYQREVKIVVDEDTVDLRPVPSATVRDSFFHMSPVATFHVNGRESQVSQNSITEVSGRNGKTLVQATILPSGTLQVYIINYGFQVTFDGLRIKVIASDHLRGNIRGLCGTFTGDPATDFTTPKNCILRSPKLFTASYALTFKNSPTKSVRDIPLFASVRGLCGTFVGPLQADLLEEYDCFSPSDSLPELTCQGPAVKNHQLAQHAPCFKRQIILGDVISDYSTHEEGDTGSSSSSSSSSSSNPSESSSSSSERPNQKRKVSSNSEQSISACIEHKMKIIIEYDSVCFSKKPLPYCKPGCKGQNNVQKSIPFHCVADTPSARHWVMKLENGATPDFTRKPTHMTKLLSVPTRCSKH